jgi:serine/threonine-protein kinase
MKMVEPPTEVTLGEYETLLEGLEEKLDGYPFASRTDTGTIQVLRLLSEQAGAKIFLGKHRILGNVLEIHQAGPEYKRPNQLRRFVGEAQLLAQLRHPCVQPTLGIAIGPDRTPAILAPHIPGVSLADYLEDVRDYLSSPEGDERPYSLNRRLEIFRRICTAMSYAHHLGVLHRDIKPDAVWLGEHDEVFVRSWGIAKLIGRLEDPWPTDAGVHQPDNVKSVEVGDKQAGTVRTRIGTVIGTPAYMSPEQAAGNVEQQGVPSDVFSLGLLLYEMTCLKPAYGVERANVLDRARAGDLDSVSGYEGEEIPEDLVAVISKATAPLAADRYASAAQLAEDVQSVVLNESVVAVSDSLVRDFQRWLSKRARFNFTLLWFLALLVLLALAWGVNFKNLALHWAAVEARLEGQGLGDFAMAAAERGADLELQFSLLSGEIRGWGAGLVHVLENESRGAIGIIDARGATGHGEFGLIKGADGEPVPAYFTIADRLSSRSRRELFRIGRHWRSWTRGLGHPNDLATHNLHRAIRWSYVLLAGDGLVTMYPGSTEWHEHGDYRETDEFQRAEDEYALFWLDPRRDRVNGDPVLTVVYPLRGEDGVFLGAFGVDIPLAYVRERLLRFGEHRGALGSYLLDSAGMILLDTKSAALAEPGQDPLDLSLDFGIFPIKEVVRGVRKRRSGMVRTDDGRLFVWLFLPELNWAYVVEGDVHTVVMSSIAQGQPK